MRKSVLTLGIITLLAITPAAVATWGAKGGFEPDTPLDISGGWMFADSEKVGGNVHKVYFNAIQGYNLPLNTDTPISANLATLGTQQQSTPYSAMALFGVWRDCNKDNYVGLGDQGLFEYRRELLVSTADESICPIQAAPGVNPSPISKTLVHNDGTWIHELVAIGYDETDARTITQAGAYNSANTNRFKVHDAGSRVWADYGPPGEPGRDICWLNPSPPGSYHTAGQIIDKGDCYGGRRVQNSAVPGLGGSIYQDVRATNNPWGETSDSSAASVFDCNGAILAQQTVGSAPGNHFAVRSPRSEPTVNPSGSISGTLRGLGNEMDDCNSSNDVSANQWGYQAANLMYAQEQGTVSAQRAGEKIQNDGQFKFLQGRRGDIGTASALGATTNQDAGTNTYFAFGIWATNSLCTTCNQYYAGRDTPVYAVKHNTFYGYVSTAAIAAYGLTLPKGPTAVGIYGSEACGVTAGAIGSGIKNGWDCDKSHWFKNVDGSSSQFEEPALCNADKSNCPKDVDGRQMGMPMGQTPGAPYNLRDVDCYDASVGPARQAGVSYGSLSGTGCL